MIFEHQSKNKKVLLFIFAILLLAGVSYLLWTKLYNHPEPAYCTQETKLCPDGSYVGRTGPKCEFAACPGEKEGIMISSPKPNEKIKSPLKIEGKARGFWFFEAQFRAELYDANNIFLGGVILTSKDNWMTENFVPFEGDLGFLLPSTSSGTLRFSSDNPSGLPENQKVFEVQVQFQEAPTKEISLYYYNSKMDLDESGNIKCSRDGLAAIKREIPVSKTPIQDAINFLLKGKQNLSEDEMKNGVTTEYPLEEFSLAEANLKEDGTLILKFNDPLNKTSGGSCRAGILWFQIEAVAKQFPEVREVRFLPEYLFQP